MVFDVMLLPAQEECTALFFHSADVNAVYCTDTGFCLKSKGQISFDAYYNLFPAKVYHDYTVCTSPTLHVTLQGSGRLSLIACDEEGRMLAEEAVYFSSAAPLEHTLRLSLPEQTAAVYWCLAAESECAVQSAYLSFEEQPEREITLAVGICTYRREEFVKQNAAKIASFFERNEGKSHHVFISDNGNSLGDLLPDSPYVTVVQNPNTGGSGGFSRTMMETLQSVTKFTHLLLMDDDIMFRPEILARLLFFLSHCCGGYAHVTVGGAMCLLDEPWIQFEAGAKFLTGGVLQGLQMSLDLRDAKTCIRNAAAVQEADYNSWWCCCMSVERIRQVGLSMPFFIKMDDVEYALRLGEAVVCLPGVCVSHESFVKKYNPALDYYIVRNTLITCALHGMEQGTIGRIRTLCSAVLRNVLLQRYDTADLILRAYQDFLKGADFLKNTDPPALHREILQSVPKCVPAPPDTRIDPPHPVSRVLRMLTLGGIMLPCKRKSAVVDAFSAGSSEGFRVRSIVHFYPMTGMMYVTEQSRRRSLAIAGRLLGVSLRLLCSAWKSGESWKREQASLSSEEFWIQRNG